MDDALALLNVALETTSEANHDDISVFGLSRGGTVGLLMAIRDSRIDRVVHFFGPTDFFGDFVRSVAEASLSGETIILPGVDVLDQELLKPLAAGTLSIDDVRVEMARRSPVYFAEDLPLVQAHHGTFDFVVPLAETERLSEVMAELGRVAPQYEAFIYEGGTHTPFSLTGSLERANTFLRQQPVASLQAPLP